MRFRHLVIGGVLAATTVVGTAGPAFAHDCFNPNKPEGAGVHYSISFPDPNGPPVSTQLGNAKGIGGFVSVEGEDVHTIGNSSSKDEVGGPGSHKPEHACDGKGIDYVDVCGTT